jgi:hypothetical protein
VIQPSISPLFYFITILFCCFKLSCVLGTCISPTYCVKHAFTFPSFNHCYFHHTMFVSIVFSCSVSGHYRHLCQFTILAKPKKPIIFFKGNNHELINFPHLAKSLAYLCYNMCYFHLHYYKKYIVKHLNFNYENILEYI